MDKFGMSFGSGPSRKELVETVETQRKQLGQYQGRFRDLVTAYKGLMKEKEALEASLNALSVGQEVEENQEEAAGASCETGSVCDVTDDAASLHSEDSVETAASTDTANEETCRSDADAGSDNATSVSNVSSRRVTQLRSQLSTLTSALATVSQEKSRMETGYQADKRQLKQEVDELVATAAAQEAELGNVKQLLAESRARVITQQHERETEQTDHVTQLRELQRIVQHERDQRQDAELRLQDANATLTMTTQAVDRGAESVALLSQVKLERDALRQKLQEVEAQHSAIDPRIEPLQRELREVKEGVEDHVTNQTSKALESEQRALQRTVAAEQRVCELEQRVSELSEQLGVCERTRLREQHARERLRERCLQLDQENKSLAMGHRGPSEPDESQLDVSALKEKMEKVKKLLMIAAQRNPEQNIQSVLNPDQNIQTLLETERESETERSALLKELQQVKEDFERYKLRAQLVLKNKNSKDGCQTKELEETRDQLSELKEKYISLRIHSDQQEAGQRRVIDESQHAAATLTLAHKQEVEKLANRHRDEIQRLEAELHRHRERTMTLVEEKEREIEALRHSGNPFRPCDPALSDDTGGDVITEALRRVSPNEPTLLLYAEQLARKEVEAVSLRRQKHQLESDVHRLQSELISATQRHEEAAATLRASLDKLARDRGREGANANNLEYLKNVIYRFLTLPDPRGRTHTLTAILTILHFSPQERQTVMRLHK